MNIMDKEWNTDISAEDLFEIFIAFIILIVAITMVKMAIILPTGQWYAPSAVINNAWYCRYCMVLNCIA